jgi:hypothetical protein
MAPLDIYGVLRIPVGIVLGNPNKSEVQFEHLVVSPPLLIDTGRFFATVNVYRVWLWWVLQIQLGLGCCRASSVFF